MYYDIIFDIYNIIFDIYDIQQSIFNQFDQVINKYQTVAIKEQKNFRLWNEFPCNCRGCWVHKQVDDWHKLEVWIASRSGVFHDWSGFFQKKHNDNDFNSNNTNKWCYMIQINITICTIYWYYLNARWEGALLHAESTVSTHIYMIRVRKEYFSMLSAHIYIWLKIRTYISLIVWLLMWIDVIGIFLLLLQCYYYYHYIIIFIIIILLSLSVYYQILII